MFEAKPSDFSIMPFGMWAAQLSIRRPKMRNDIPRVRKCAAIESPYGPAPIIAVSIIGLRKLLSPWILLFVAHRVACEGWSYSILARNQTSVQILSAGL